MMLVETYIAASTIEGIGAFAAKPIAKGAMVWRLDYDFDRLIPVEKFDAAPETMRAYLMRYTYPAPDVAGMLVLECDNGRLMNHAASPNTDFSQPKVAFALRDIAAGEELTCNYGEFAPGYELFPSLA